MQREKKHRTVKPHSKNRIAHHSNKTSIPIAPLPDPIGQNIEAIVHKRRNDAETSAGCGSCDYFFGRPAFLYSSLVVALWLFPNVLPESLALPQLILRLTC